MDAWSRWLMSTAQAGGKRMAKHSHSLIRLAAVVLLLLLSPILHAQDAGEPSGLGSPPGITEAGDPSGFAGGSEWVIDDMMRPFQEAQVSMGRTSGGASNDIGAKLGLTGEYLGSGIGGQFLATIVGADLLTRSVSWFSDAQIEGPSNPVISGVLSFGTHLGVLFTSLFLGVHALTAFFNKMEYGDILGQSKDRVIGGFRAILAFGLIMPITASGIAGATHGVAFVAAASNGMANKAAEIVVNGGFGSNGGGVGSFDFGHDYSADNVSRVFSQNVGQDTCRQYMNTIGASAADISRYCGGVVSRSSSDIDIEYDPATATAADDMAFCEAAAGGGGWRDDTRYHVAACQSIVGYQRKARERARDIIERYDGDLENPEARRELEVVATELHSEVQQEIVKINEQTFDDFDAGTGDNYLHSRMSGLISEGGWPALGVIYADIGTQIDAVNGIQAASNSGGGFDIGRLEEAGAAAQSARRIVQRNATISAAAGAAQAEAGVEGGGSRANLAGRLFNWLSDAFGSVTDGMEDMMRGAMVWLFEPIFTDPGPAATHKIGSNVLGGALAIVVGHDVLQAVGSVPGVSQAAGGAKSFFKFVAEKSGLSNFAEGSMLVKIIGMYVSLLIMLMLLVSSFLVVILPKLPIFFVAFLALEWAIWSAILIFASPLWVALNLTAVGNQPGLFSQRALGGLGVLAYLLLFPTMVVIAVVVSLIAYNLIIPVLGVMLLMSFGGGGIGGLVGAVTMPFMVLLSMSIGGFVAVSAIMKVPSMITGLLGIQAPGDSVSQQASTFIATPLQYSNVTSPQSLLTQGGKGMMKATGAAR